MSKDAHKDCTKWWQWMSITSDKLDKPATLTSQERNLVNRQSTTELMMWLSAWTMTGRQRQTKMRPEYIWRYIIVTQFLTITKQFEHLPIIDYLHFYSPHHLQCKWCGHARILVTSKNCIFTIFEIMSPQ